MEVRRASAANGRWAFEFRASAEEDTRAHGRRRFEIELPSGIDATPPHPDVLALALLLVVRRWSRGPVTLPVAVSRPFAEAVACELRLELTEVDESLTPRRPPARGRPGLAFSGGVDSLAALLALPEETASYFLERRVPDGAGRSLLRTEASAAACAALVHGGRTVRVLESDLEYTSVPVGYPDHYGNAIPAMLCSELDELDAVAWGVVAESAYRIGKHHFIPFLEREVNRRWYNLFVVAGLPMLNPMIGVSEVGTTAITLDSPYSHLARSCVRGTLEAPCHRCWKCFRKQLIESALTGRWPSSTLLDQLMHSHPVRAALATLPIKHEVGLTWSLARYDGSHDLLRLLARRVRAGEDDVSFLKGWYPPSVQTWPARWREDIAGRLDALWPRQTAIQQAAFEAFDLRSRIDDPREQRLTREFTRLLDAHAGLYGSETDLRPVAPREPDDAVVRRLRSEVRALRRRVVELEDSRSYRLGKRIVRVGRPFVPWLQR
jgi:hypothetical protein